MQKASQVMTALKRKGNPARIRVFANHGAPADRMFGVSVADIFQHWPGDQDNAGIDISRFDEAGKVVEHWDVLQAVPDESANDDGMF